MTSSKARISAALFGLTLASAAHGQAPESQQEVFDQLSALEGAYEEQGAEPEATAKVDYQQWSRGSAIVETWQMPTKREFTVFHMDNDKLVATHYCGAKIQITMDLVWPIEDDVIAFKPRYLSNLSSPDAAYNSGFGYKINEDGTIWRNEFWTVEGKESESSLTLEPVDDANAQSDHATFTSD